MPKKDDDRTLQAVVPADVAEAAEQLAAQEDSSISRVVRRALTRDLRDHGLLPSKEAAA